MYYVHTDHLGSLNKLPDENGNIAQELSYDAWGNRRNPATLQNLTEAPANLITDRGFTGHEHMDAFKLINMNGRIYDPVLGRFLSPDNFVENPGNTQDYNRYSYCSNSPLMYTDPSGYIYRTQYKSSTVGGGVMHRDGWLAYFEDNEFPMMGTNLSPRNGLEYDIQLAQNVDRTTGSTVMLDAVRGGVEIGNYYDRGLESKTIANTVFGGADQSVFRGFNFTDRSSWYTEDGLPGGGVYAPGLISWQSIKSLVVSFGKGFAAVIGKASALLTIATTFTGDTRQDNID